MAEIKTFITDVIISEWITDDMTIAVQSLTCKCASLEEAYDTIHRYYQWTAFEYRVVYTYL